MTLSFWKPPGLDPQPENAFYSALGKKFSTSHDGDKTHHLIVPWNDALTKFTAAFERLVSGDAIVDLADQVEPQQDQIVLVLVTVAGIQVFDLIYVMTQGGPGTGTYTVMWYIYQDVFAGGAVGYAAAMGVFILVLSLLITGVYLFTTRTEGSTYE